MHRGPIKYREGSFRVVAIGIGVLHYEEIAVLGFSSFGQGFRGLELRV